MPVDTAALTSTDAANRNELLFNSNGSTVIWGYTLLERYKFFLEMRIIPLLLGYHNKEFLGII